MATDGRIFIFGGQAIDETTTEVYSIEDTVNWYQVRELVNYSMYSCTMYTSGDGQDPHSAKRFVPLCMRLLCILRTGVYIYLIV